MADTFILVENLRKRYKDAQSDSLFPVSFSVNTGEKFGVLGPNGAGKTTLISILTGILNPSSGKYHYIKDGVYLQPNHLKMQLGFVPQDYAFYDMLTAMQNMMYFGALYKLTKKEILKRSEELFEILDLQEVAHKKVVYFSGGMKRRLNLAIGIVHRPLVLFLDEPTVGADVQSKHAMIAYLNVLNEQGTTIIYTSHHMQEAQLFCNRIAFIRKGRMLACDTPYDLMKRYKSADMETLFINLSQTEDITKYV